MVATGLVNWLGTREEPSDPASILGIVGVGTPFSAAGTNFYSSIFLGPLPSDTLSSPISSSILVAHVKVVAAPHQPGSLSTVLNPASPTASQQDGNLGIRRLPYCPPKADVVLHPHWVVDVVRNWGVHGTPRGRNGTTAGPLPAKSSSCAI